MNKKVIFGLSLVLVALFAIIAGSTFAWLTDKGDSNTITYNVGKVDYEISLTKPGDEVIYTFDVVNSGTLNSSLKDIIMSKIKCKSSINLKKDEEIVCGNIIYELEYLDGNKLKINDELKSGDRRPLKLTLKYDGNTLPENKVQVYNITTILLYNQK